MQVTNQSLRQIYKWNSGILLLQFLLTNFTCTFSSITVIGIRNYTRHRNTGNRFSRLFIIFPEPNTFKTFYRTSLKIHNSHDIVLTLEIDSLQTSKPTTIDTKSWSHYSCSVFCLVRAGLLDESIFRKVGVRLLLHAWIIFTVATLSDIRQSNVHIT